MHFILTGMTIGSPLSDSSAVCSKYSSQMRRVHSIHASRGRAGFDTSEVDVSVIFKFGPFRGKFQNDIIKHYCSQEFLLQDDIKNYSKDRFSRYFRRV